MKMLCLGISLCLSSASVWAFGNNSFSDTDLIDMNQNLTFRPKPPLLSFQSAPNFKIAKVHFIVNKNEQMGFEYQVPAFDGAKDLIQRCQDLGFKKAGKCAENEHIAHVCPYLSSFFDYCCNNSYAYSKAECSYPLTISSDSCAGKFKCYCDTSLYPYTSANCDAPKELADKCVDASGVRYAQCKCPSHYKPCSASNMQGVGTPCNDGTQNLYASCECKPDYKYVCEQFGPSDANDYCMNGAKYYKSCKTCGDYGYLSSCPDGIECSFEQCSGKYFPTGKCAAGYTDISDASCNWYKCWMPYTTAPQR